MTRVVLFGVGELAKLAHFYLTHDSPHEVAAFTVDGSHLETDTARGLPVVPFEDVQDRFPPNDFGMFVCIGYAQMNKLRASKYDAAKELGYDLISYISSTTTTWPGTTIGENCFIMEHNVLQPFVTIGNDVVMWSGCHINHEAKIHDHCFFSSQVVVAGFATIEPNCFLGLHTTIRNGITVARECVIGAGSLIMKDTRPREVYAGNRGQLLPVTSDRLPPSALTGQVTGRGV